MADKKISQLSASATPLAGTEILPVVQSGATVKTSVADLTLGRPVSAASLTLTTGNLTVSNGKGIDFSATPGAGTSELLADYEEGVWTPVVTGGITNPTISYTRQEGTYIKTGRLVTATASINVDTASGGAGQCIISLPFAAANGVPVVKGTVNVGGGSGWGTAVPSAGIIFLSNSTVGLSFLSGTSYQGSNVASFGSGADVTITCIYEAQ